MAETWFWPLPGHNYDMAFVTVQLFCQMSVSSRTTTGPPCCEPRPTPIVRAALLLLGEHANVYSKEIISVKCLA